MVDGAGFLVRLALYFKIRVSNREKSGLGKCVLKSSRVGWFGQKVVTQKNALEDAPPSHLPAPTPRTPPHIIFVY